MSTEKNIFLPGWGVSASIWHAFHPSIAKSQCIDMPDFSDANECALLEKIVKKVSSAKVIHAWSHSGLWLLKLLKEKCIAPERIYLYGLPLEWQFKSDAKKQAFIRQYELNPQALALKFIKLLSFPYELKIDIAHYCLLSQERLHQSQLNYLKWMFSVDGQLPWVPSLVREYNISIVLAECDAIVNSLALTQIASTNVIQGESHLGLLQHLQGK